LLLSDPSGGARTGPKHRRGGNGRATKATDARGEETSSARTPVKGRKRKAREAAGEATSTSLLLDPVALSPVPDTQEGPTASSHAWSCLTHADAWVCVLAQDSDMEAVQLPPPAPREEEKKEELPRPEVTRKRKQGGPHRSPRAMERAADAVPQLKRPHVEPSNPNLQPHPQHADAAPQLTARPRRPATPTSL